MEASATTTRMPAGVKTTILLGIALLLAAALYLIAVRGDALILDLAKLGQVLCL